MLALADYAVTLLSVLRELAAQLGFCSAGMLVMYFRVPPTACHQGSGAWHLSLWDAEVPKWEFSSQMLI